jgi:hypothetical protein
MSILTSLLLSSNSSATLLSTPLHVPFKKIAGMSAKTHPAPLTAGGSRGGRGPLLPRQGEAERATAACARPLPWERTGPGRLRGRREEARRPSLWETLSQDGVCEAAGCGVSAPRRGLPASVAVAATTAPPLRPPLRRARPTAPASQVRPSARPLPVVSRWQRQVPARPRLAGRPSSRCAPQ